MNISRLFVLRPVATSLLMIAFVLIGLVAVRFLPVSSLPDVDYPTIQVQTFYPGASPQVMATTVTAPLEVQLGEIPGLTQMTSASSAGASVITLQFSLALSLDIAEQDVQQAINAANSLLPTGLPAPPVYAKVNPADQPILTLAITSDSLSLTQLQDLANNRLASKISEVSGVAERPYLEYQPHCHSRPPSPSRPFQHRTTQRDPTVNPDRCPHRHTSSNQRTLEWGPD